MTDVALPAAITKRIPARALAFETRWQRRVATSFTLALHIFLLLAMRESMRADPPSDHGTPLLVELIDSPATPPDLVVPPLGRKFVPISPPNKRQAPAASVSQAVAFAQTATSPVSAAAPETPDTPSAAEPNLHIYNLDGSLNIPKDLLAQIERMRPKPNFIPKEFLQPDFMRHKNPLHYLGTDFEPSWVPLNEDLLAEFIRRNLTREVTFKTPWGGTIRCTWIFVMGACAGVPPPAWKNLDERTLPPPAPEWQ